MQMTMRWYGSQYDTVTLQKIRQTAARSSMGRNACSLLFIRALSVSNISIVVTSNCNIGKDSKERHHYRKEDQTDQDREYDHDGWFYNGDKIPCNCQ